jgi:hypothetical protein
MTRPRTLAAVLAWASSRLLLALLMTAPVEKGGQNDVGIYLDWAKRAWDHGVIPGRDFAWEYPPGALPLVLLPVTGSGKGAFLVAFAALMLLFDLALLLGLTRTAHAARGLALWIGGPLLLGPVFLARFDVAPAVLAALALIALRSRPRLAGALLAVAAAVKLWPAALLATCLRRRDVLAAAAVTGVVIVLVCWATGVLPAFGSAVTQQHERGLQLESVAGTPFVLGSVITGRAFVFRHGALEVTGPGTGLVASLTGPLLAVLAGAFVLALLRRRDQADPALASAAVTALLLVADKALSPQYLVWLLATTAVAATRPFRDRTRVLVLLAVSCALTHLVYPLGYLSLLEGSGLVAGLLVPRNVLLVVIAGTLVRATLTTATADPDLPVPAPEPVLQGAT